MTIPVHWLTSQLAIAPQINAQQIPDIAAMGFKTIICNRPDNEYGPGQPTAAEIEQAATDAGLRFAHHPVAGNGGTAADAKEMGRLFAELPAPVLAYCASGGRCMALIGVTARMGMPIPQ